MCGRFSFAVTAKKIEETFGGEVSIKNDLKISYNIAPTQDSYVITNTQPQLLQLYKWGLIPYWAKNTSGAARLINARSEGIDTKPSFRTPINKRRCLVVVDSFYEWKRSAAQKIPYRIRMKDDQLMVMAGIWDSWTDGKNIIKSFSIITTEPNEEMKTVHNRMPVILENKDSWYEWLADQPVEKVLQMLKTPPNNILDIYRVSTEVNSVRNNAAHLHREVPETPTLFDGLE
jgi:putative SOS response-associated peptidase YedK